MDSQETKDSNRRKKRKLSKKKKIIISAFSVLLLLIVFIASGYFYVRSKIYRPTKQIEKPTVTQNAESEETVEYRTVEGITNVLLLGVDGIDFDAADQRSDSMIIATLDSNNKKIKLTSLYRDALVYIPGYGENKMNASFSLGGPELVMETIKYNYDINIEKYVMINFVGFEAIIDQIGGIEIDVQEYQLNELNKYIGEATGGNDCTVEEPGLQTLNGKQALSYARIRKGVGDDYERTERQREVIFKVAEKLQKTKPIKYLGIATKMLDYLRTNIDLYECLDLAYTVFKFPSLVTEQLSIPVPELSEDVKIDGIGWVISMDRYENAEILNDFIFNDYLPDFILNRSTEKDPSIYFEYDGFGSSYDESYYYEEYYYEEDYYTPEIYEPIEEEVIQPEEPSEDIVPPVNESNTGDGTITDDGSNQGEDLGNSDNFDNNQMSPEGEAP
ncbi:LCP family protein [Clostridium sp. NSJ-49]|uniref:LCP family protein n=1 Tax=Clostridium TaxID=1485 RepID=UPI001FAB6451|nr:LCP family protein [Clostridium sp. NSJ-49]